MLVFSFELGRTLLVSMVIALVIFIIIMFTAGRKHLNHSLHCLGIFTCTDQVRFCLS